MQVILGANAKDENHLVMITAENVVGEEITHPLCWLSKKSVSESQVSEWQGMDDITAAITCCVQCSMHMALSAPVTMKLAQG